MQLKKRFIFALLATLFTSSALFSGIAAAHTCEYQGDMRSEYEVDYND
jgi:hypothetical protein